MREIKKGEDMIEFKIDESQSNGSPANRLRVIGLGQAGIGALDQIVMYGMDSYDMLVMDTDQQSIEGSVVKQRLLLGAEITRGLGCGGDHEVAAEIATACSDKLTEAVSGCNHLILSVGLGGATACMVAPELVIQASKQGIRTIVVATMPFSFESRRRQSMANKSLERLRRCADSVLVFANDRITTLPQASGNIRQGFHIINQLAGHSIEALAQILSKPGLIQLSFADVRSLYGRLTNNAITENCWAGWSEVSSPKEIKRLVDDALSSPLFTEEVWSQADHAIVCLSGGGDLSLVQVQNMLAELQKRLPADFPVATGATLEETCKSKLRLTVLLARTVAPASPIVEMEPEPEPQRMVHDTVPLPSLAELQENAAEETEEEYEEAAETDEELVAPLRGKAAAANDASVVIPGKKTKKYIAKQEELQFDGSHRGRFEKSIETIYKGENLDQPTFRRRKLAIRL